QEGVGLTTTNTQITKGTGDTPTMDIGATLGLSSPGVSRIEADYLDSQSQLRSLEAERERLTHEFLAEHPRIKELDNKIAAQKTRIQTLTEQAQEEWSRRVTTLDLKMDTLKSEIAVWEVKARESNEKIVAHLALKSEYERLLQYYGDWKRKLDQ